MKVLLVVDDYLPSSTKIAAKMMHELALEFIKRGNQVYVVTPGINLESSYYSFDLDGVKIYQFASGEIKNVSKFKRAINETLLSFRAWNSLKHILKQLNCELIVYYSPSIFWGLFIRKLRDIWKARTYLILRDFFPQWAIDNGLLRSNSIITKFFQFFEKINYSSADKIGLMSPGNLKWFGKKYKDQSKLEVLYNWVSDRPIKIESYPYRTRYNLHNKLVFFYGGNIGHAQDMSQILRLAKNLRKNQDVYFVLVGTGDEVALVRETIQKDSLTNLLLLDPVPQNEFIHMLAEFDIGLFCLNRDHTTHNFPGKILSYLVQSKPILGSVNPGNDLKEVIGNSKAGIVVEAGDDSTFLEAATKLLDKNIRELYAKNCNVLLKQIFSVESACDRIQSK
ncbi:glycosyltransferase family 4 protein [Leptospira sp. WS4.C2]